ncbi:amidohydrolase family protein [Aspergillus pseudodeflectus]|uniref:Amidohydrolase family protein n=1 Tax=Aspergillus pseudodeflectus TaxID=176178 RepID=A0ABR4L2H7_9EURO
MPIPIVDSHIHLFPESHLPTLAWYSPENPGPLGSQHSIDQYREATRSVPTSAQSQQPTYLRGFIFVETDRLSSVEEDESESEPGTTHGWRHALDEVSFLARIASGVSPIPGEGHSAEDRGLCLAIVPWAPVPGGPGALAKYMALVRERTGSDEVWQKVRGVRYLVQDKPSGVMLRSEFVEGLKWLGRQGLTFDLGVDARQGGIWQLEEAVQMLRMVYEGVDDDRDKVKVVINHMCKPNLRLSYASSDSITAHPEFLQWKSQITAMAHYPSTYMKLSGAFSEIPPLSADTEPDMTQLLERVQPWTDVVFDAFGPERVMFGSDWPVCNVGGGGNQVTWDRWRHVVESTLERGRFDTKQRADVWGQVAVRAYGVRI